MFFQLYFCHCNRTYIGQADKKRENNIYHETIICFVLRKINVFQLYFCHCNRTYIGRAEKNVYHETIICFVLRKINEIYYRYRGT